MSFKRWFTVPTLLVGFLALAAPPAFCGEEDESDASSTVSPDSINMSKRHLSFGQRYYNSGQYKDAETQLLKAWSYNPKRATTARYLGRLYNKLENYEEAITWYKKAIELDPRGKYTKGAYYDLANIYIIQANHEEAIACFEALLGFSPDKDEEIKYLHSLVSLNVEAQNLEQALEYAKRWGELAPDDPQVREMIGKLHLHTGGEDEALAEMEKVLEMNPGDFQTRDKLAGMYLSRGDLDKAFDAYEILHKSDPKNYFYLEKTLEVGKKLNKPKSFIIGRLEALHALQPNNLAVVEQLADLTGDLKWVMLGLKKDGRNGKYPYMMGEHHFDKWKAGGAAQDSIDAMRFFKEAEKDPQWSGNAKAMIQTIDPPLSDEEKMRRKFFEKKKKQEVNQEGKK